MNGATLLDALRQFHWVRPAWLLLLPLALLWLWRWRPASALTLWQRLCDDALLPHALVGPLAAGRRERLWLLLAVLLLVLTLAGPSWRRQPVPLYRDNSALVVLLDLSPSMLAADLPPNRLVQARLKLTELLRQRHEGQTALVVFAADAFSVVPLTEDVRTIELLLPSLTPALLPRPGSAPQRALELGLELLRQAGSERADLLLVTDEDQPQIALEMARTLRRQGHRLHVLAVGTTAGAPVPATDGGFVRQADGALLLARPDHAALQALAAAGGGRCLPLQLVSGATDLAFLQPDGVATAAQATPEQTALWRDEGIWLLWPLTLVLLLCWRRGLLWLLPLLLWPAGAQALDWNGLWQAGDQRAA
ncbi:MAG: VWA domain-containing protein, partial [Desulfuromonas thiophila]|nr:VWA domain-containing protein [Desulfuromonas thiophila]